MSARDDFVARYGGVFEHSSWIAEAAFDAGLEADSPGGLHDALCTAMRAAPHDRRLALITAHPDLAGKLSRSGRLTAASSNEQASAGLDQLSDADFDAFTSLNESYTRKFSMPFIMAVKGCKAAEILAAFKARLGNDHQTEFETALCEIEKIALFRISTILEAP